MTELTGSYFQHEQWYVLIDKVYKVTETKNAISRITGKKLINSYGKVRYIFEDGTYFDDETGQYKTLEDDQYIEE